MREILISVITIALAIYFYVGSMTFAAPEGGLAKDPALYPQILAIIFGFLGFLLLVNTVRDKKAGEKLAINSEAVANVLKLTLSLSLYTAAISYVGFPLSTVLFCFATIMLLGGRVKTAATLCLPITFGLYLLFFVIFQMPMPQGSLW